LELVGGWVIVCKWGWVGFVVVVVTSYCYCCCLECTAGRLCCSRGCVCWCSVVVGSIEVGVGLMACIFEVVVVVVGAVGMWSIVVVWFSGVGVGSGCVCVLGGRGCVVWTCVIVSRAVVGIVAVGVCVVGGAASFLGACQKTSEVYPVLPPSL
jgi:hypothetical protein